jgi:hypothetical protein
MQVVAKVLTVLGYMVERALTGRSDFRFITSDFQQTPSVNDLVQARMVLKEVQSELKQYFGLSLQEPVLLNLERPPVRGWKAAVATPEAHIGRYVPRWLGERRVHRIMIVPGLDRPRFRAVLAHELVHAWQSEKGVLRRSRGLREGMARWVEYHVLLRAGRHAEARRLLGLRRFLLGRSWRSILDYERRHGRQATVDWLRTLDEVSPGESRGG